MFRCDSSYEIGTGHVIRCLSMAYSLRDLGLLVHFLCKEETGNIYSTIRDSGFDITIISKETPLDHERSLILGLKPHWIVVDHYSIDSKWESQWKDICYIFVIDDLANRDHEANALLDQNFHIRGTELYTKLLPKACFRYVGPQFSLVRKTLLAQRRIPLEKKSKKKILCFFGGTDFSGETLKFLTALKKVTTHAFFQVVVGKTNRQLDEILRFECTSNFEILVNPANWDDLMFEADLYFGSGGIVTWERFIVGLAGVVVSVAENQAGIAKDLADAGLQLYWGNAGDDSYELRIVKLDNLVLDSEELVRMSQKSRSVVRAFPAALLKSIFEPLGAAEFQIKRAMVKDAKFIFTLRNDPVVRNMSKNANEVTWEEHLNWFHRKLSEAESRLYIGFYKGQEFGQFRVDSDGITSVAIQESYRGKGLAAKLISQGCDLYLDELPSKKELTAEIKVDNKNSIKSFEKAGYEYSKSIVVADSSYFVYRKIRPAEIHIF